MSKLLPKILQVLPTKHKLSVVDVNWTKYLELSSLSFIQIVSNEDSKILILVSVETKKMQLFLFIYF